MSFESRLADSGTDRVGYINKRAALKQRELPLILPRGRRGTKRLVGFVINVKDRIGLLHPWCVLRESIHSLTLFWSTVTIETAGSQSLRGAFFRTIDTDRESVMRDVVVTGEALPGGVEPQPFLF
jgi:hypothetical protein